MENRDKISRKEILRLLKKNRLEKEKKLIVIAGVAYVPEKYVCDMIKAMKGAKL